MIVTQRETIDSVLESIRQLQEFCGFAASLSPVTTEHSASVFVDHQVTRTKLQDLKDAYDSLVVLLADIRALRSSIAEASSLDQSNNNNATSNLEVIERLEITARDHKRAVDHYYASHSESSLRLYTTESATFIQQHYEALNQVVEQTQSEVLDRLPKSLPLQNISNQLQRLAQTQDTNRKSSIGGDKKNHKGVAKTVANFVGHYDAVLPYYYIS